MKPILHMKSVLHVFSVFKSAIWVFLTVILLQLMRGRWSLFVRWFDHRFIIANGIIKIAWLLFGTLLLGGIMYISGHILFLPEHLWGEYSHNGTIGWSLAYSFLDPGYQHSVAPHARWFGLLIAIFGVGMVSLLTGVLSSGIDQRADKYKKGLTRYYFKNQIVILGANDMVASIIANLRQAEREERASETRILKRLLNAIRRLLGRTYTDIVVMTSTDTDKIESLREHLLAGLTASERKNIEVLYGDRSSKESLRAIHIANAKRVFLLGENDEKDNVDSFHDALNMFCLNIIKTLLAESNRANRLPCHMLFEYQTTFSVFQKTDISEDIKKYIEFLPFNFYEMHAQKILIGRATSATDRGNCDSLEGCNGIKYDDDKHVHLIIVGMSRMGIAMAIEAAHLAHYPNFVRDPKNCRTRITFIDKCAYEEKDFFMGRYKDLFNVSRWRYVDATKEEDKTRLYGDYSDVDKTWHDPLHTEGTPYYGGHLGKDFIDIDWEFINGHLESGIIQRYLSDAAKDTSSITTIAICLMQSNRAVAGAMYMPDDVYDNAHRILVFQRHNTAIIKTAQNSYKNDQNPYKKLTPFGCKTEMYGAVFGDFTELGKRVNYVYEVQYATKTFDHLPENEAEMAFMNEKWRNLVVAKKWSSIYNANSVYTKLRSIGFDESLLAGDMNSADDTPIHYIAKTEHHRWNIEKLLMGFRPMTATEQRGNKQKIGFAHKDICSYDVLDKIDKDVIPNDYVLSAQILNIIEHTKRTNETK